MQEIHKCYFPGDPDTVVRMFTDKDYFLEKYEMTGATSIELLDHEFKEPHFTILVRRDVPADVPLPGFAKKFMSETMTVTQRDSWDTASKTGRLDIELKGVPVDIGCDMQLLDDNDGSVLILEFDVKAHVPLIGKKVERLIMDDVIHKIDSDSEAGVKLLGKY